MKNTTTNNIATTAIRTLIFAISSLQNDNDEITGEAGWFRHFDTIEVLSDRLDKLVQSVGGTFSLPHELRDSYFDIIEDVSDVI